ncbi:MAG TPA: hypothetical protein VGD90_03850 [Sphingobacteriaceae bacterium]
MKFLSLLISLFLFSVNVHGQSLIRLTKYLYKPLDIEVRNAPLGKVLEGIGKKGGFFFSYSSELLPQDSLVSLTMKNVPVAHILDQLLQKRFEYRESPGYVILRPAFSRFSILPETIKSTRKIYQVSGFIRDEKTGEPVQDVSIYEKRLLRSTLTDKDGYFKLKFRGEHQLVMLSASRENYRDTTVVFLSGIHVGRDYGDSTTYGAASGTHGLIENSRLGRFFVSSRQKIQNMNIPDFLANTPFQASLLPGLSSQGLFSSSVVNKVSLNVFGGYTAGVKGVEVAGMFNINKGDVKYFQAGGISNLVGGSARGIQLGGVMNTVLINVNGIQVAGVGNTVKDTLEGVQVGGIFNAGKTLKGAQVAGIANYAKDMRGLQVAGILNVVRGRSDGAQVGLLNSARTLKGLQIGLINTADTSSGYSIGLFNWVRKGYHKLSYSTNETMKANFSLKTGNSKLYTILTGGKGSTDTGKVYAAGLGLGHDFILSKRISLSAEITTQYLYAGNLKELNLLNKGVSNLQVRLFGPISVFAGPSYNLMNANSTLVLTGSGLGTRVALKNPDNREKNRTWIGWNVGLTVF